MKQQFRSLDEETGDNDNLRARRYVAKYTINPAIAQASPSMSDPSKSASGRIWFSGRRRSSA